jgi:hypothetical protein
MLLLGVTFRGRRTRFDNEVCELPSDRVVLLEEDSEIELD